MKVNSEHEQFKAVKSSYQTISDILSGERAIKAAGTRYIPMLGGQSNASYSAYVNRGCFYNAFGRTVAGLTGAMLRKWPQVTVPAIMEPLLESITVNGGNILMLVKNIAENVMAYGRYGLLVDQGDDGQAYIAEYPAITAINWRDTARGRKATNMIVLRETVAEYGDDPFEANHRERIRVLYLENNKYTVQTFIKNKDDGEYESEGPPIIPKIRGQVLDYIPFIFVGANDNGASPCKPPLEDLAMLNLSHWRMTVDLKHGLHYCALPTPWASGFDASSKLYIGPEKAWISDNENARCGFLEFSGAGLKAIQEDIEKTEKQMAVLGARMLEEQRKGVEAAETVKLRSGGDLATLAYIAASIEGALEQALRIIAQWSLSNPDDVEVDINKDFVNQDIDPGRITALLHAWQAGGISLDTFLYNLQEGEAIPSSRTIEDERMLIDAEGKKEFK